MVIFAGVYGSKSIQLPWVSDSVIPITAISFLLIQLRVSAGHNQRQGTTAYNLGTLQFRVRASTCPEDGEAGANVYVLQESLRDAKVIEDVNHNGEAKSQGDLECST
jgi:hypothetical protein